MRKIFSAALTIALASLTIVPARAEEDTRVRPRLIGHIWIPSAAKAIDDLTRFAEKLKLPTGGVVALRSYLGALLENPTLSGVKLDDSFRVVVFNPSEATYSWAVGFQLNNPDSYLKVLEKSLSLKNTDGETGIRTYIKETQVLDREAFLKAKPEDRKHFDQFNKTLTTTLYLDLKENTAWLAPSLEILEAVKDRGPLDFRAPVTANLALVLRAEPLLELIRKKIEEKISRPDAAAASTPSSDGEPTKQTLQTQLDLYLHYARQVAEVTIGITADADGIVLEKLVRAEPGSGLGEFLREQKPGRMSLARYLEPGAVMIADGFIRKPEMFLGPTKRFFSISAPAAGQPDGGNPEGLRAAWLNISKTYFQAVGDEIAVSLSSSPEAPFTQCMIQSLKDPAAYRAYVRDGFAGTYELVKPFYDERGITYDLSGLKEPREYQGVEVHALKIKIDRKKLLESEAKKEADKQLVAALPEEPITMEWAVWKNLGISRMAWGGEETIDPLLERVMSGKSALKLKGLTGFRRGINGAVYFSLNDLCRVGERLFTRFATGSRGRKGTAILRKLAALDFSILWTVSVDGETVKAATVIPMEKIAAFKEAVAPSSP